MGTKVQFGNYILSRWPLESKETVFTNGEYGEFDDPDKYISNIRNAQIVSASVNGQTLTIVNHHGYWEPNPYGSNDSMNKLKTLSKAIKHVDNPLIVVGDFNLSADSEPIMYFKESLSLKDLVAEHNIKTTLSNEISPWQVNCDHIFLNDQIKELGFTVSDELLSDHKALVLEFSV